MDLKTFGSIMRQFQAEGGFQLTEDQKKLWMRQYAGGDEIAFRKAVDHYLSNRKDSRTPQPGQLKEVYKDNYKASTPLVSDSSNIPGVDETIEQIMITRAHNLCRRWQGFFGYDEHGRIESKASPKEGEDVLLTKYADLKQAVYFRAKAIIDRGVYKGAIVPDERIFLG